MLALILSLHLILSIHCHFRTMWSDFYQILTGIGHAFLYRSVFHQFIDYFAQEMKIGSRRCILFIYSLCVMVTLYYHITFSGPFKVIVWYAFLSPRVSILRPCLALQQEFGGRRVLFQGTKYGEFLIQQHCRHKQA